MKKYKPKKTVSGGILDAASLRVRISKFSDGERCPLLCDGGIPLLLPTLYITTEIRSSKAAKTLEQNLRAIMLLYRWAEGQSIDVEARYADGEFLTLAEIDSIVRQARLRVVRNSGARGNVVPFKAKRGKRFVDGKTSAARLYAIRNYLDWLALRKLSSTSKKETEVYCILMDSKSQVYKKITARIKSSGTKKHGQIGAREGLPEDEIAYLLKVIDPASDLNPWKDSGVRVRNQLIITMLYSLGIRRGELLGIKLDMIDFQANQLMVVRRADDPEDPRIDQSNAKTNERLLDMSPALSRCIYDYVIKVRSQVPGARRSPFLIVTHKAGKTQGQAMSSSAYHKVFSDLRKKVPDISPDLTGHVMRHCWNEAFSRMADAKGMSEVDQQRFQTYLNGWNQDSQMVKVYNRRRIREKSKAASLELQKNIMGKGSHG